MNLYEAIKNNLKENEENFPIIKEGFIKELDLTVRVKYDEDFTEIVGFYAGQPQNANDFDGELKRIYEKPYTGEDAMEEKIEEGYIPELDLTIRMLYTNEYEELIGFYFGKPQNTTSFDGKVKQMKNNVEK